MVGRKVGRGKELRPPLDREERESIDSNPRSVRRFISPPPIRGPPEIHAYTDSEEEEEKDDIAALHEDLAMLNSASTTWMRGWWSRRSTEWT